MSTKAGETQSRNGETQESVRAWAIAVLLIVDPNGDYDGDLGTNDTDLYPIEKDRSKTVYVNQYFEVHDGIPKRFIFAGGLKIATDTKVTGATNPGTFYHHSDHLSGASVGTDENGDVVEVLDYFPFGDTRLDEQYASYQND